MNYEYTSVNQFKYIERYAYSKVDKKNYLEIFRKSRLTFLLKIKNNNRKIYSNKLLIVIQSSVHLINKNILKLYSQDLIEYFSKNKINKFLNPPEVKLKIISNNTRMNFEILLDSLLRNEKINLKLIDFYISRYENTKRIYQKYRDFKKKGSGNFKNINNYINFSLILSLCYLKFKNLKFLNTLLKINDLIISQDNIKLSSIQLNSIIYLIIIEKHFLSYLQNYHDK